MTYTNLAFAWQGIKVGSGWATDRQIYGRFRGTKKNREHFAALASSSLRLHGLVEQLYRLGRPIRWQDVLNDVRGVANFTGGNPGD